MNLKFDDQNINVFTITPRTLEAEDYWENIDQVGEWCGKYDFTGPLLFTGNDTFVEPWVCCQAMVERYGLSPLIAINPLYAHPFTVAKMVSSIAYVYEKQIFLNMVTGTAVNHAHQLNCFLDHDEKYVRLLEYIQIVQALISREGREVVFEGEHYKVDKLALVPAVPENLRPDYFIAGHSEKATWVRDETGAIGMKMLMPELAGVVCEDRGIHFGVVTRETEAAAWEAANKRFPEDRRGQHMLDRSMKNTESVWKKRLKFAADAPDQADNGYWLAPFRNFQADCPYFVGSHEQLADVVAGLIEKGVTEIILDVPGDENEFEQTAIAFELAGRKLESATPVSERESVLVS
ncbi:MAG: LLM class flavin-dependent oxidoreductase [Verrucomicrobiales bacterium]|nr:LLM class flavin-dependent oxidoreductase [Verrucomicrobiales bacterium]